MKKIVLLAVWIINSTIANAFIGEKIIDGIKYYIVTKAQTAAVLANNYHGNIVIPSTIECEGVVCKVNEIGKDAFKKSTITSVYIPSSIEKIGQDAFSSCNSLKTVNIPSSVIYISMFAFAYCNNLTSITLPDNEISIGPAAFSSCGDLKDVYCFATSLPSITGTSTSTDYGSPLFQGSYIQYATLHVPASSLDLYKSSRPWKDFKAIVAIEGTMDFGPGMKCSKPTISYSKGELTFYCETEGSTCKSTITDTDITSFNNSSVSLDVTYHISVYATKAGYENSEITTATLCWIDANPKTEGLQNNVAYVPANAVLIQSYGNMVSVQGAEEGMLISVYDTAGRCVGSARASNEMTSINTSLSSGDIGIVKIGEKAVKVVMK